MRFGLPKAVKFGECKRTQNPEYAHYVSNPVSYGNIASADPARPTAPGAMPAGKNAGERNDFADFLKGALILLVVWGHLIQGAQSPSNHFYQDPVFKAIYMFHMPLFMAVSGYLSFRSISRLTLRECSRRRFLQVILPAIFWPATLTVICLAAFGIETGSISGAYHKAHNLNLIMHPVLWFFWAVFGCTVVVGGMRKFEIDRLQYFAVAAVLFLFAPDGADLFLFKYVFPYFCLGYALARGDQIRLPDKMPWIGAVIALAAAAGCYWLWRNSTYVYVGKTALTAANLPDIGLRYVSGAAGSAAFVIVLRAVYGFARSQTLSAWGRGSLNIYAIHCVILAPVEAFFAPQIVSVWFSLFGAPVLAAVICWLTNLAGDGLGKVPVLGSLYFGKPWEKRH